VAKRVGRSSEFLAHTLPTATLNDVLGGCPNPFRGRASSCQSAVRGLPRLAKICLRIDVQSETLHDMDDLYEFMNIPKLYRLARSPLTQHDPERSNTA